MRSLVLMSALFLVTMAAQTSFGATAVPDNSLSASSSNDDSDAPMVSTKYKTPSSSEGFGVSRVIPQVGIISSTFVGGGTDGINSKTGLAVGGLVDFGHSSVVLETGLQYRQLGGAASDSGSGLNVEIDLNYLAVPIGAKWYIGGQDGSGVFLKGGMLPQILVSKSATLSAGGQTISTNDLQVNTFDFDLYAGLGGKIAINESLDVILDGTFTHGLTNVNSSGSATVNNQGFGFMAGVGFAL